MQIVYGLLMAAIIQKPDKNTGFGMVSWPKPFHTKEKYFYNLLCIKQSSLDHFKQKKNILYLSCIKRSSLEGNMIFGLVFEWLKQDGRQFENWTKWSGY